MKEILCDQVQLDRLLLLIEQATKVCSSRSLRRWRIFSDMCGGLSGAEIARKEGVTAARVSVLKRALIKTGLDAELTKLDRILRKQSDPAEKRKRGRPRFEIWEDLALSKGNDVRGEPFIELASVILTPSAHIAVLVVFNSHRHLNQAIKTVCSTDSKTDCHWTFVSGFDRILSEILLELEDVSEILEAQGDTGDPIDISSIKSRFAGEFTFCVLQSGNKAECAELLGKLFPGEAPYKTIPADEAIGFFDELSGICCRLRERWSCIGLFPSIWELYNDIAHWRNDRFLASFVWEIDSQEIANLMKVSRVAQDCFAVHGTLLSLSPSLWRTLPFYEEADFRTLTVRPKIEVLRGGPQSTGFELKIQPLPEVEFPGTVTWRGDPDKLPNACRNASPVRFRYSARSVGENSNAPAICLNPSISIVGRVVLLPRHYLSRKPVLPLDLLSLISKNTQRAIFREVIDFNNNRTPFLILYIPELLAAILKVFQSNFYGDRHRELLAANLKICHHFFTTRKGRNRFMAGYMQHLDPFAGPYYHFGVSDPQQYSGNEKERLRHRAIVMEEKVERGYEPCENPNMPCPADVYCEDEAFKALLTDFDADFLLAGFDQETREVFEIIAAEWAECVKKAITEKYWDATTGKLDMQRIHQSLPENWRKSFGDFKDEIHTAVPCALTDFCNNSKRVIRTAIETAQRLTLAGYPPATIVIEDENAILKAWRVFLRHRIVSSLLEEVARRKSLDLVGDVETVIAAKSKGKKNTSIEAKSDPLPKDESLKIKPSPDFLFQPNSGFSESSCVDEIHDAVSAVLVGDYSDRRLLAFVELAREESEDNWEDALTELGNIENPSGQFRHILTALELCRRQDKKEAKGQQSEAFLTELRRTLEKG
ncbi:MAG: hypothetical protein ACOYM3_11980 [Terrimicrobiaceae bacterium]